MTAAMQFKAAAAEWLESRTFAGSTRHRYLKPRTLKSYTHYAKALCKYFGDVELDHITLANVREYQHTRASKVGPNKINQEVGLLVQVMRAANAWTAEMQNWYQPLQHEETDIPHALTIEEQERFLHVLSGRKEYEVLYCYTLVSLSTTMGTNEMRGIQLGHVNLVSGILSVPTASAKNKYRQRTVPLDEQSKWALTNLIGRAQRLGAREPQHYLFPFRVHKKLWDATRSMSEWGLRKPWDAATQEAGIDLRMYDIRHSSLTRYAEAGTPIPVMMSYAGHVSMKMLSHYIRICEQAQRQWQARAFPGTQREMVLSRTVRHA